MLKEVMRADERDAEDAGRRCVLKMCTEGVC